MHRHRKRQKTHGRNNMGSDEIPGRGWHPVRNTVRSEHSSFRDAPYYVNRASATLTRATEARVGTGWNQEQAVQAMTSTQGQQAAVLDVSRTQSDSVTNRQESTGSCSFFYGANMGNETRNIEFKRGHGDYLRSAFHRHLRRYACAFLNSGGGSLLVGVDDNGVIRGIILTHRQEDSARLLVDSILKGFQPPLLPHSYSLVFKPVVKHGPGSRNLKVLCLTVRPPSGFTPGLYQTDQGEVFLRRDGSVEGPLTGTAIQEWARQRWSGEVTRLQHCVDFLLYDQRLLVQQLCHQNQTIAALQDTVASQSTQDGSPAPGELKERLGAASSQHTPYPALTSGSLPLTPRGAPGDIVPASTLASGSSLYPAPTQNPGRAAAPAHTTGPKPYHCF